MNLVDFKHSLFLFCEKSVVDVPVLQASYATQNNIIPCFALMNKEPEESNSFA